MALPPSGDQVQETLRRTHDVGGEFLIADLELALAMLDRIAVSQDGETRTRNLENARNALRTVNGFLTKLDLEETQLAKVMVLRDELERRLGSLSP